MADIKLTWSQNCAAHSFIPVVYNGTQWYTVENDVDTVEVMEFNSNWDGSHKKCMNSKYCVLLRDRVSIEWIPAINQSG